MKTYWFEVIDENSELCGEEFFVESDCLEMAWDIAVENFGDTELTCHGTVSYYFAEMMGYDTY